MALAERMSSCEMLASVQPIQYPEHPHHLTVRRQQRYRQKLPHAELRQKIEVNTGNFAGIIGPEDLLADQSATDDAGRNHGSTGPGFAIFRSPADMKYALLEQAYNGPAKAQEIGGTDYEPLQKLLQIADGPSSDRMSRS